MFRRFAMAAERAATSASRREFLGRLGKVAMGAAGAVGTVLLLSGNVQAHAGTCWGCLYKCPGGGAKSTTGDKKCAATYEGCNLAGETKFNCNS